MSISYLLTELLREIKVKGKEKGIQHSDMEVDEDESEVQRQKKKKGRKGSK